MRRNLEQNYAYSLFDLERPYKKLQHNYKKNKQQDQTDHLDRFAEIFNYQDCKNEYWNPENYSLLWGTPLWDEASASEKIILNQLYWVAYYSQIISAEIATIFLNQTSAAGLYAIEDFKLVCDTLDFESMQERTHINVFKTIAEQVEEELFGKRIFTYPMRYYFAETMIFQKTNMIKKFWKRIQLQAFSLLSSGNAFIACQYLTVRGLRTLNGKIVQHELGQFCAKSSKKEETPIPSQVSYHHFLDESFHFNSSKLIGSEVLELFKSPTKFEKMVANMGVKGSLKDHSSFSVAVRGIFWYDPAIFQSIYDVLTSKLFNFSQKDAIHYIYKCFCEDNEGIQKAYETHQIALESYRNYLSNIDYVSPYSKQGGKMGQTSIQKYLKETNKNFSTFKRSKHAA